MGNCAHSRAASFRSEGFTRFFGMLTSELGDEYLQVVEGHLKELGFRGGTQRLFTPISGSVPG